MRDSLVIIIFYKIDLIVEVVELPVLTQHRAASLTLQIRGEFAAVCTFLGAVAAQSRLPANAHALLAPESRGSWPPAPHNDPEHTSKQVLAPSPAPLPVQQFVGLGCGGRNTDGSLRGTSSVVVYEHIDRCAARSPSKSSPSSPPLLRSQAQN